MTRRTLERSVPILTTEHTARRLRALHGFGAAVGLPVWRSRTGLVVTMDAVQGAGLAERIVPRQVLPVHYEEYSVMKSPPADFLEEARRRGFSGRLVHCRRGESAVIRAWVSPRRALPSISRSEISRSIAAT